MDFYFKQIDLIDYRRFTSNSIQFEKDQILTGWGKSSVVAASVKMLKNLEQRIRTATAVAKTMKWDDIHHLQKRTIVTPTIDFKGETYKWSLCSNKRQGNRKYEIYRKNYHIDSMFALAIEVNNHFRKTGRLPLFSYFYRDIKPVDTIYRVTKNINVNPIHGYRQALTPDEAKTQCFLFLTMLARHVRAREHPENCEKCATYDTFCKLIADILPFLKGFSIGEQSETHGLTLINGTRVRYPMLSTKEKRSLHFVGDLLWRIFILNNMKIDNEAIGVVFIDDADYIFQSDEILRTLKQMFPKIQFIITANDPSMFYELFNGNVRDVSEKVKASVYYDENIDYENKDEIEW